MKKDLYDESGNHSRFTDPRQPTWPEAGKIQIINEPEPRCECHDCTQARWKMTFQYQIDSALCSGPKMDPSASDAKVHSTENP